MSVEADIAELKSRVRAMEKVAESLDGKVDQIIAAMNMGKGAWVLLLKVGAVFVAFVTAFAALVSAAAWVFDKFHK